MGIKAWIGIDPGQTGAAALLSEDGDIMVSDWEDAATMAAIFRAHQKFFEIQLCALEKVHAMPKQGVSSTFKFGVNFGTWLGIIAALGVSCLTPRPTEWQKGLVRKSDGPDTKTRSLTVARRMFPQQYDLHLKRKKDHGRADALLLAWWAKQQCNGK